MARVVVVAAALGRILAQTLRVRMPRGCTSGLPPPHLHPPNKRFSKHAARRRPPVHPTAACHLLRPPKSKNNHEKNLIGWTSTGLIKQIEIYCARSAPLTTTGLAKNIVLSWLFPSYVDRKNRIESLNFLSNHFLSYARTVSGAPRARKLFLV